MQFVWLDGHTVLDRTRTPQTVRFTVCWQFAIGKDGVSALSLQHMLEIGSYQTAWAILHRLRSVLMRPSRERLRGTVEVEVDETFIGGDEPGLRGLWARGKKVRPEPRLGYAHDRRRALAGLRERVRVPVQPPRLS
jgi:hypothetical protein